MPVSNSSDLIAMVSLTWDTRSYQPGDKFKPGNLLPSQRRTVDRMIHSSARKLAELTAENMALALQRRAMGTGVPKGFTLAGLLGLHFITEEQVKRFGWDEDADDGTEAVEPAKEGGEGGEPPAEAVRPEWLGKDTEAYPVQDLWVVRQKSNGGPPRYDVNDAKGERVLPGGTIAGKDNAIKKAEAFIEQRGPAPTDNDDTLMGSSVLPAIVEVAGYQIQLGGVVAAAFEDFSAGREGITDATAEWNDLAPEGEGGREERLQAMIDLFAADPAQIDKRVPETSIVARPEAGADDQADAAAGREDQERLKALAEVDLDAMDVEGIRAWLATQDMHGLEDATEDRLREAAGKIRDAAADQLKAGEPTETSEGNENGGELQSSTDQPA